MRTRGGMPSPALTHKLDPRTHVGITTAAPTCNYPIEPTRWRNYRGALRGVSPRTREGRNGPTVQTAVAGGQELRGRVWPGCYLG